MKNIKYFFFASPFSLEYSYRDRWKFKKKDGYFISRIDGSKWIEVKNYNYYGNTPNCIIPAQMMDYEFVFNLLKSNQPANVFGAINYLFCHYQEKFVKALEDGMCPAAAAEIIFQYFRGYIDDTLRYKLW